MGKVMRQEVLPPGARLGNFVSLLLKLNSAYTKSKTYTIIRIAMLTCFGFAFRHHGPRTFNSIRNAFNFSWSFWVPSYLRFSNQLNDNGASICWCNLL